MRLVAFEGSGIFTFALLLTLVQCCYFVLEKATYSEQLQGTDWSFACAFSSNERRLCSGHWCDFGGCFCSTYIIANLCLLGKLDEDVNREEMTDCRYRI